MKVSPGHSESPDYTRRVRIVNHWAFPYLVLAVLTLAVFSPVRTFDYIVYDDPEYVVKNPMVRNGITVEGFVWSFRSGHSANWHPVTWLSHMLDTELTGPSSVGPHVLNLFFHVSNALLLLLLLRMLTAAKWPSFVVAALFALHPLHVESVSWVSERKDVLSTFFGLLCLLAYSKYADYGKQCVTDGTSKPRRRRQLSFYALALICFVLGLMSKPMLVTWPFVMLLLDYWPLQRFSAGLAAWRRLILEKAPFFLLSAGSCVITLIVQGRAGAVVAVENLSVPARLGHITVSYVRYLAGTFWPNDLIIPYPFPRQHWPFGVVAGCAILVVGISIVVVRFRRQLPFALVGWFWFLGTLVPVIGFLQVGIQAMADRYSYIPLVGIFVFVVWGAAAIIERCRLPQRLTAAATILVLGLCIGVTSKQLQYWRNSGILFAHTLSVTPDNSIAHIELAAYLSEANRPQEAIEHYLEGLRLLPGNLHALIGIGTALGKLKQYPEAIEFLQTALRGNPNSPDANLELGTIYAEQGQFQQAIERYQLAIKLAPENAIAHYRFGNALMRAGRTGDAIVEYGIAHRYQPDSVDALNNLGVALLGQRKAEEAAAKFRTALRFQPDNVNTLFNLGNSLAIQEKWNEAAEQYLAAVRLAPTNAACQYGVGLALARSGRREEALRHLTEALRLNPSDTRVRRELQAIPGTSP